MSDPNLPEGVTQRDIDRLAVSFDENLCEHENLVCENCEITMAEIEDKKLPLDKIKFIENNLKLILKILGELK